MPLSVLWEALHDTSLCLARMVSPTPLDVKHANLYNLSTHRMLHWGISSIALQATEFFTVI